MLLSVIIPFYENIHTIDDMLFSLKQAILASDIFFEIIFIDNNSFDGTTEKVSNFLLNVDFARITKEPAQGVSYARNTGILNAKGKYISFIDADDAISKDYFKYIKDKIKDDYDVVILSLKNKKGDEIECNDLSYIEKNFLHGWWNSQFVYKKSLHKIPFQGRCYEDIGYFPFILSLSKKTFASGKQIYYYNSDNNISITHSDQRWREGELIFQYNFIVSNRSKMDIHLYRRIIRDILHLKFYLRAYSCMFPASSTKEVLLFLYLAVLRKETVKMLFSFFRIFLLLPRRAVKLHYLKK